MRIINLFVVFAFVSTSSLAVSEEVSRKEIAETAPSSQPYSSQQSIEVANRDLANLASSLEPFFLDMETNATSSNNREMVQCVHSLRKQCGIIQDHVNDALLAEGIERHKSKKGSSIPEAEYVLAFSKAIQVGVQVVPPQQEKEAEDAAYEVGLYLEHLDPQIASAASLWQGVLFYRIEQPERALLVLPPVDKPFETGTWTYELTAKLFRCQVIARNGGYPTAIALLYQLEELIKAEDCQIPKEFRENCIASVHRLMRSIFTAWSNAAASDPDLQEWCREHIASLPEPKQNILPLQKTVPMYDGR